MLTATQNFPNALLLLVIFTGKIYFQVINLFLPSSEWVSSLLMAHQHIIGYSVP